MSIANATHYQRGWTMTVHTNLRARTPLSTAIVSVYDIRTPHFSCSILESFLKPLQSTLACTDTTGHQTVPRDDVCCCNQVFATRLLVACEPTDRCYLSEGASTHKEDKGHWWRRGRSRTRSFRRFTRSRLGGARVGLGTNHEKDVNWRR